MFLCPHCGSDHVRARNYGKIVGGVIGLITGAIASVLGVHELFHADPRIEQFIPAPSRDLSSTILHGIAGATSGCMAGIALGDLIDENILPNYHCEECHRSFRLTHR